MQIGHCLQMDEHTRKRNQGLIMHGLLAGELDPAYERYCVAVDDQRALAIGLSKDTGLLSYATHKLGSELVDIERDALIYAVRPIQVKNPLLSAQLAKNLLFQATLMVRQGDSLWPQAYDAALLKWASIAPAEDIGYLEDFMHTDIWLAQTAYTATWSKFYHSPPTDAILKENISLRNTLGKAAKNYFHNEYMVQSIQHSEVGIEAFIAASVLASPPIIEIASAYDIQNNFLVRQTQQELEGLHKNWTAASGLAKDCVEHIILLLQNIPGIKN